MTNLAAPPCFWQHNAFPTILELVTAQDFGADCGGSVNLAFAAVPVDGSLILLFLNDNTGVAPAAIAGFNKIAGGSVGLTIFWKIAASEANAYTYTYGGFSLSHFSLLTGIVITGASSSSPIDNFLQAVATKTTPNIPTLHSNSLVLSVGGDQSSSGGFATAPSAYTLSNHQTQGTGAIGVAYFTALSPGLFSGGDWNSGTYTVSGVASLVIRP